MVTRAESKKRAQYLFKKLDKKYGATLKTHEQRSILSQLIFQIIARNFTLAGAERAFKELRVQFVDWNEVRVSSVSEVAACLRAVKAPNPEKKAKNIRNLLAEIYAKYYRISLDFLTDKPEAQVEQVLSRLKGTSDSVVDGVLLFQLDHSIVPRYSPIARVARRTGIVDHGADRAAIAKTLTTVLPKKDLGRFCRLVVEHAEHVCHFPTPKCSRCLLHPGWCTDPKYREKQAAERKIAEREARIIKQREEKLAKQRAREAAIARKLAEREAAQKKKAEEARALKKKEDERKKLAAAKARLKAAALKKKQVAKKKVDAAKKKKAAAVKKKKMAKKKATAAKRKKKAAAKKSKRPAARANVKKKKKNKAATKKSARAAKKPASKKKPGTKKPKAKAAKTPAAKNKKSPKKKSKTRAAKKKPAKWKKSKTAKRRRR